MGGASDIRQRLSKVVIVGVGPSLDHRSGPPFVGPVSVSLAGALVGNRLLAGSMHGMGS